MSNISLEHIIQMMNHQRHDWLNHIQVLHGLLKLESYEEIKHYLEKITTQLQNDQYISQLRNPEFILYIHTYSARNKAILFEVEMDEIIHLDQYNISQEKMGLLIELLEHFTQCSLVGRELLPSLLLTMGKLDNNVQFTLDFVGYLNEEQFMIGWSRIRKQMQELGILIKDHGQSDNEWLIEIHMG